MTDVAAAGEEAEPLPEAGGQLPERQVWLQKHRAAELLHYCGYDHPQQSDSRLRLLTSTAVPPACHCVLRHSAGGSRAVRHGGRFATHGR